MGLVDGTDLSGAIRRRNSCGQQARRLLRKQMKKGRKALDGGQASDEDIHDARKHIKHARATLRLLRKALARADYPREEQTLRSAAQPLSAARDAKIVVEALDGLQRYPDARHIKGAQRFRRALVRARVQARRRALTDADGVNEARKLMDEARSRAKHWTLHQDGWRQLAKGAVRRYAKGRDALREVNGARTVERLAI